MKTRFEFMNLFRRRMRETDWAWVSACMGVVEGDICPVEAYLNSGGDPTRLVGKWRPFIFDFFPKLHETRKFRSQEICP